MSDYSSNFPQQRPTLSLDFANSGKLDSRLSYSRSSGGTFMSNEKALSSENLLPYSNDLSGWSSSTTTTPSTNNLAPDGTNTATAVIENTATSGHNRYKSFSSVSGTNYTFLTFAKANGRTQFQVVAQATTSIANVKFDLTAVTSTVTSGSAVSHSIIAVGSTGWYKCEVTVTATGTGSNAYHQVNLLDATGTQSYTGDGVSGLYLWGMQVSSTGETALNATSGSIHREFAPTLKTAAADEPRFEYAADGQSEGLLIESQAENLQTYGSDFSRWNRNRVTTTSNVAIAPNGLLEADIVIANTSSTQSHNLSNTSTLASGTTYTASVYAKDAGQRYIQLSGSTGAFGSSQYATFDLQTGSVDTTGVTASAVSVGNGWWRIQATMTATASVTGGASIGLANSATSSRLPLFVGNEYDGLLLWGSQLETGSAASSLVDTGTGSSQLSRAADSCSVATSSFGYTGGPVSVYTDADAGAGYYPCIFALNKGDSATDSIRVFRNFYNATTSTPLRLHLKDANATIAELIPTGSQSVSKVAIRVEANNTAIKPSGVTQLTDTTCTTPVIDTLEIGGGPSVGQLNGHIKRLSLFNVALSDTELQAITS